MSEQLELAPCHANDPQESRDAAAKVKAEHQLHLVLRCLYEAEKPLTDDEIAERCGLLRTSAGTRRGVAVKRGLVVRVGRGLSALGNPCGVWRITAEGVRVASELRRAA